MQYYLAPLEGITGYIYRNAYNTCFGGIDKYFTPFLSPGVKRMIGQKEMRDILPENNRNMTVVPQVLTNKPEGLINMARLLEEMGYREVNLNLGCPSGTVVSKRKAAGFLEEPDRLDAFFEEVFEKIPISLSVKTRIGVEFEEEFEDLLMVYNRYPFSEVIIHPRLQKDYYKNKPHMDVFQVAAEQSKNPVCYNGDLFTPEAILKFRKEFPQINQVMLGRGILANPFIIEEMHWKETHIDATIGFDETQRRKKLKQFHEIVVNEYLEIFGSETPVLYKMKEIWSYMICQFENNGKYKKGIRKAKHLSDYHSVTEELFANGILSRNGSFCG